MMIEVGIVLSGSWRNRLIARSFETLRERWYSGPQKVDHSGYLHLLRLFPSQPL